MESSLKYYLKRLETTLDKYDINIKKVIVHILESTAGIPVLSDEELDYGSEFGDFLREHIYKIYTSDDIKNCSFYENESEIFHMLQEFDEGSFAEISRKAAMHLYGIMNANIDIPSADLVVVLYTLNRANYLAFLKMNYKSLYTHITSSDEYGGNMNQVIMHKALLPGEGQKLSEAALICLDDLTVRLVEKKYDINGVKENYFSKRFLNCSGSLSPKAKLSIVTKAVEKVQEKYIDDSEQFEAKMKAKSIIHSELEEQGTISVPEIAEKIFEEQPKMKEEFQEQIEKYKLSEAEISLQSQSAARKFSKQHITTDTGIEIKIPMEQYENPDSVEFITNQDGTVSVLIKNIGRIVSK